MLPEYVRHDEGIGAEHHRDVPAPNGVMPKVGRPCENIIRERAEPWAGEDRPSAWPPLRIMSPPDTAP
ncbi:MAG: hypothetical protein RL518_34 [Pseudomonadota bacterium]|jgi:hypothetical protein